MSSLKATVTLTPHNCHDPFVKRQFSLSSKNPVMKIGRASRTTHVDRAPPAANNATFSSEVVSRHHAELSLDGPAMKLKIRDVGSMHGTLVNGEALQGNKDHVLKRGDRITLGSTIVQGPTAYKAREFHITWQWAPTVIDLDAEPDRIENINTSSPKTNSNASVYTVPDSDSDSDSISDSEHASRPEDSEESDRELILDELIPKSAAVANLQEDAVDLTSGITQFVDLMNEGDTVPTSNDANLPLSDTPKEKSTESARQATVESHESDNDMVDQNESNHTIPNLPSSVNPRVEQPDHLADEEVEEATSDNTERDRRNEVCSLIESLNPSTATHNKDTLIAGAMPMPEAVPQIVPSRQILEPSSTCLMTSDFGSKGLHRAFRKTHTFTADTSSLPPARFPGERWPYQNRGFEDSRTFRPGPFGPPSYWTSNYATPLVNYAPSPYYSPSRVLPPVAPITETNWLSTPQEQPTASDPGPTSIIPDAPTQIPISSMLATEPQLSTAQKRKADALSQHQQAQPFPSATQPALATEVVAAENPITQIPAAQPPATAAIAFGSSVSTKDSPETSSTAAMTPFGGKAPRQQTAKVERYQKLLEKLEAQGKRTNCGPRQLTLSVPITKSSQVGALSNVVDKHMRDASTAVETSVEPPKKKARTLSATPFLAGAIAGGLGVLGALIALPESFFLS